MRRQEDTARERIRHMLEDAGWRLFDGPEGPANVRLDPEISLTRAQWDELGGDFRHVGAGRVDFLLLDGGGAPLAVLEAKPGAGDPLGTREQARAQGRALSAPFALLSNGSQHYFWDLRSGEPQAVAAFPSPESLRERAAEDPARLYHEEIGPDYLSGDHPLRPHQLEALRALQAAVRRGERRFVFELAVGTGKTRVAAAVIRLFLRTGNARRVLYLTDRAVLAEQAAELFGSYPEYRTALFQKDSGWEEAHVVAATAQSLLAGGRYKRAFRPGDFSLLIADEVHPLSAGSAQPLYAYFLGFRLALTSAPSAAPEPGAETWADRRLEELYRTFGCRLGEPTYRYALPEALRDGLLVRPVLIDARAGLPAPAEGERVLSEEALRLFTAVFLDHALRDPVTGEVGKGLLFCANAEQAETAARFLNEYAGEKFPGKYPPDFALRITADAPKASELARRFRDNTLGGRTRVCVTVAMLATGFDCPDLLNVGLLRPVGSRAELRQLCGRGTRTYDFVSPSGARRYPKTACKVFDFLGNCARFQEPYDEVLSLPAPPAEGGAEAPAAPDPAHSLEEAFEGYALTHPIPAGEYERVKRFFAAYAADPALRRALAEERFQLLGTDVCTYTLRELRDLGLDRMHSVADYVAEHVELSRFSIGGRT